MAPQQNEGHIVELYQIVHGKVVHSRSESLDVITELLHTKQAIVAIPPMQQVDVMLPEYSSYKAKSLAEDFRKAEKVFEAKRCSTQ